MNIHLQSLNTCFAEFCFLTSLIMTMNFQGEKKYNFGREQLRIALPSEIFLEINKPINFST